MTTFELVVMHVMTGFGHGPRKPADGGELAGLLVERGRWMVEIFLQFLGADADPEALRAGSERGLGGGRGHGRGGGNEISSG